MKMGKQLFFILVCTLLAIQSSANQTINTVSYLIIDYSTTFQNNDDPTASSIFEKALAYYNKKDYVHALPLFKQAGEKGHAESLYYVGMMYFYGKGVSDPDDHSISTKWYKRAAEKGHPLAQCCLSEAYMNGYGIPKDELEGFRWLEKAAEQGVPSAQSIVSHVYYHGEHGLPKDIFKAIKYGKAAAEQGESYAKSILKNIYDDYGDELVAIESYSHIKDPKKNPMSPGNSFVKALKHFQEKEYREAIKYFRISAVQGDISALFNLGQIYYHGYGVPKDYLAAFQYYINAAKLGDPKSQYLIGYMYYDGIGIENNFEEASKWFIKSASQNYPKAQYYLGNMYSDGKGVVKDLNLAYKYLQQASESNDEISKDAELALLFLISTTLNDTIK